MNLIKYIVSLLLVIVSTTDIHALTKDVEVGPSALRSLKKSHITADQDRQLWIWTLIELESGRNMTQVGDLNLPEHAYGPLQIRQTVLDDVNPRFHCHYVPEQCLGNLELSWKIFFAYQSMWATKKWLGHEPTIEDEFRIWNGGPSRQNTDKYWDKAKLIHERFYVRYAPSMIKANNTSSLATCK